MGFEWPLETEPAEALPINANDFLGAWQTGANSPSGRRSAQSTAHVSPNAVSRERSLTSAEFGSPERQTHDYKRHGTTTLFAALNVLEGSVIGQCQPRHRHQEFIRFLDRLDQSVGTDLDIHLVLDNYGTHKHPEVRKWFAARPRYSLHFTPTRLDCLGLSAAKALQDILLI